MAEESDARSMGQPSHGSQEVPEAGPSSSNSIEARFQQMVEENQRTREQVDALREAMQALLTRLPQAPQGSISEEHPESRGHSVEAEQVPHRLPTSTHATTGQELPPTNTLGVVPQASPSTHGVEQQVPPPYVPMQVGQFWPPSAFMPYSQSSSGGMQHPYSAPHTATWPGFAAQATIPPPSQGPQAQPVARLVPQQAIPPQVVQPLQAVPQRVVDPEIQALKDVLPSYIPMPAGYFWPYAPPLQAAQGFNGMLYPYSAPHSATWPGYVPLGTTLSPFQEPQALQATTMACSHPHPPRNTIGVAILKSLSATGVALQEPTDILIYNIGVFA